MKIVICSGGTGSRQLQKGLYEQFEKHFDGFEVKVLINAYDNGLSTGLCREVYDGNILGPSDLRKNQMYRLELQNPNSPHLPVFNERFTCSVEQAEEYCLSKVDNPTFRIGIKNFFRQPKSKQIEYDDFSLGNIIYAGLAGIYNNSLREAGTAIARIVGIEDNVILNDDTSLFLGATTESGVVIEDEGDIVEWNSEDQIVSTIFKTASGEVSVPILCDEAKEAILSCDLLILSSGTQWSSLIPTYQSFGFADTVEESGCKVIMVQNVEPDKDAPYQSGPDLVDILNSKYFRRDIDIVLVDEEAHPLMKEAGTKNGVICDLRYYNDKLHNPELLAKAISKTFFGLNPTIHYQFTKQDMVFDYDDTLVGRKGKFPKCSEFNVRTIQKLNSVSVCTGNTHKEIGIQNIPVFAEYGTNKYYNDEFVGCLDESLLFTEEEIRSLPIKVDNKKVELRGNCVLAIKPCSRRDLESIQKNTHHIVEFAGTSTIEIHKGVTKKTTLDLFSFESKHDIIYYIDDQPTETDHANIETIKVHDPSWTTFLLKGMFDA